MPIVAAKPDPNPDLTKALQGLLAASPGGASAGRVYMGEMAPFRPRGAEEKGRVLGPRSKWVSEDAAMNEFYKWNDKKRGDFLAQLVVGGLVPAGAGVVEAEKAWQTLVKSAGRFGAAGQKVTPLDLLASYVKAAGGGGKDAWRQQGAFEINTVTGKRRFAGPGTYLGDGRALQIDSRTDLTDPDTARALATRMFQQMMGRDPGAGELSAFASALHAAESANPVRQTTITQYDMETGQAISQNTQSEGGLSADARAHIAEQQIKGKKEYGVTQAVTTYQGALENLIFGGR
ncbi:hypothetical protein ACFPM3_20210 [Streptomyces coeruleoprunus]|uniref:Uncharacterized protein n=1 Tax=Streptomyces coeruleoprunus TaxID=285563 RepID=A0ABV9XJ80_9ACTN